MRTVIGSYETDDDPGRIDVKAAVEFLTAEAYWHRWRDAGVIAGQIRGAGRVVGVYDAAGAMVGFARAFGDGATYYLADVYVLPGHRGAGLGKAVVRAMIDDGPAADARWMLHTADAHGLYRQFGFTAPDDRYLERPGAGSRPASRARPAAAGSQALAASARAPAGAGAASCRRTAVRPRISQPRNANASATITPRLAYCHEPALPPSPNGPSRNPCQLSQFA